MLIFGIGVFWYFRCYSEAKRNPQKDTEMEVSESIEDFKQAFEEEQASGVFSGKGTIKNKTA